MSTNSDQVTTTSWSPQAGLIDPATLSMVEPDSVLLLPDKIDDLGKALYRDGNAGLVKTARVQGARIDFAWPKDNRAYLSEFGAGDVANIALAVVGNFTYDTVKYIIYAVQIRLAAALHRGLHEVTNDDRSSITVKLARFDTSADRRLIEGFECSGPASDVVKIIQSLTGGSAPEHFGGESDDEG